MLETEKKVLATAAKAFAKRGYGGASIRQICAEAGVSANAIHYHFGNKRELYRAVLASFGKEMLEPLKTILRAPSSATEFHERLQIYMEQAMRLFLSKRYALEVLFSELASPEADDDWEPPEGLMDQATILNEYFSAAKDAGLLRDEVDIPTISGMLLERMANQVRYSEMLTRMFGADVESPDYLHKWIKDNLEIIMHGVKEYQDVSSH